MSAYAVRTLAPCVAIAMFLWVWAIYRNPDWRSWRGVKVLGELTLNAVILWIAVPFILFGPFILVSWLSGHARFRE
jgi:hypothetical protein